MNKDGKGGKNILSTYMDGLLGLTGLVTILIISIGVFFRFVLKISMAWSDELLRMVFIWSYFIGAAMLYREKDLMRLELLDEGLKAKNKTKAYKLVKLIQEGGIFLFSLVIGYFAFNIIKMQVINKQVTTTSGSPAWIFSSGFAIGMGLFIVFSLEKFIKALRQN